MYHIYQPYPPRGTKRTTTAPFTNTTSSPPSCPQHPDKIQATTMSLSHPTSTHIISVLQSYSTSYNCDSVISSFRQILTSFFSLCCSKAPTQHTSTCQQSSISPQWTPHPLIPLPCHLSQHNTLIPSHISTSMTLTPCPISPLLNLSLPSTPWVTLTQSANVPCRQPVD